MLSMKIICKERCSNEKSKLILFVSHLYRILYNLIICYLCKCVWHSRLIGYGSSDKLIAYPRDRYFQRKLITYRKSKKSRGTGKRCQQQAIILNPHNDYSIIKLTSSSPVFFFGGDSSFELMINIECIYVIWKSNLKIISEKPSSQYVKAIFTR